MKILLLAPFDLFPPVHGGSTFVYNFIKHISKDNQVYALISHLYSQGGSIDLVDPHISIHYCPSSAFDRFKVLSFFFNPYYFKSAYELMKSCEGDVIQCEPLWTALAGVFLKKRFGKPLLLVEENVEYLKFKGLGKPSFFTYWLKKIERFACRSADKIVVLSEADKASLIDLYGLPEAKIETIIPCPNLDIFSYDEQGRRTVRDRYGVGERDAILTFVGNLKYIPNINAVQYLAESAYPALIERYPQARFIIIGQGDEDVSRYERENMVFTGYIDRASLIAHLSATDIFLVPIDVGSGVRIKILEAAACSRAIVSTRKGAEGLDFLGHDEMLLVDGVGDDFVAAVMRLIEDEELRKAIGEKAREKVEDRCCWEREIEKFERIYTEVTPKTLYCCPNVLCQRRRCS